MQNRTSHRRGSPLLAAAIASVGLAGLGISSAQGGLFVELRALSATGTGNDISPGGKTVTLPAADGRTVTMGFFARISGTNAVQHVIDVNGDGSEFVTVNDDALQSLAGAFTSGFGPLKGNMGGALAGPNNVYNADFTPFNVPGSCNGVFADFDSDGDLDLGVRGTDLTNMWACRADPPMLAALSSVSGKGYSSYSAAGFVPNTQDTLINATTSEVRIGTLRFIATAGGGIAGNSADIQFIIRQNLDAAGLWFEDGTTTGRHADNSAFSLGAPVRVQVGIVPEPATIGLLGVASLGLLARRRSRMGTAEGHH